MIKQFFIVLTFVLASTLLLSPVQAKDKPTIAVAEFQNQSGAGWWRGGMGWEIAGMVSNELASTGDFRVVERKKLQHVLREQDLAASGRVRRSTAAKMGRLTGAKYLVMGTVTSYEESTEGTDAGFSFKGISIGGKKKNAYIAVDLRVVDSTTGEIVAARTIEAKAGSGGLRLGLNKWGFGGKFGKFSRTPAGKAVRACVTHIVDYLDCALVKKGNCLAEFDAAEQRRKAKTKGSIQLDE